MKSFRNFMPLFMILILALPVMHAHADDLNLEALKTSLKGKTADAQVKIYREAFYAYPQNENLRKLFKGWLEGPVMEPFSHVEQFKSLVQNFTPQMSGQFGADLTHAIGRLYREKYDAEKRNKLDRWLNKKRTARANEAIDFIEANLKNLPPNEKVFALYAKSGATPVQRNAMTNALYYKLDKDGAIDQFDFLHDQSFSLKPDSKSEFDQALRRLIEERFAATQAKNFQPVGPVLFDRLMFHDPAMAQHYLPVFLDYEFFPQVFGERSVQPRSALKPSNSSNYAVKDILYKIGEDKELKEKAHQILTTGNPNIEKAYSYAERFEDFLPLVDTKTPRGSRFVFALAPSDQLTKNPEYLKASQNYLMSLIKNPDMMVAEMRIQGRFSKIFWKGGDLKDFFPDQPAKLAKFAKSFLESSAQVHAFCEGVDGLNQAEAARTYKAVLQRYLESGIPDLKESSDAISLFKKFVQPAKNSSWAHHSQLRILNEVGDSFDAWVKKEHPTLALIREPHPPGSAIYCDPKALLETFFPN